MRKIKKCLLPAIIFLLFLNLFLMPVSQAKAAAAGLKLSPVRIEDIVDPGESIGYSVKVKNESATELILYAHLRDFVAEGEYGRPRLLKPGEVEGAFLASWIDITDEGLQFAPGEEREVPFIINVPESVGPGGYYGAVVFSTEPPKIKVESEEKGAGFATALGATSLVLLQVKGDIKEELSIREFSTDKDFYNTPFDIAYNTRMENRGNVHSKPIGNIVITNMLGREVGNIFFNEKGSNILPNSFRRFTNNWQGDFGFGRYKASLGISYGVAADEGGQGKKSLFAEKSFWIIPWKIVTIVLLSLLFLISVFWLLLRTYKSKAIKRAMEQAGIGHVKYTRRYQGPSPVLHLGMILLVVLSIIAIIIGLFYFMFFA